VGDIGKSQEGEGRFYLGRTAALLHQFQVGLAGFEKHFDVPALAINTDNLLV